MNENDDFEEEDDIIEEIHRIREAIWEKAGGTPEAYGRYYYELSQKRLAAEAARRAAGIPDPKPEMSMPWEPIRKSKDEVIAEYHRACEEARKEAAQRRAKKPAKPGRKPAAKRIARTAKKSPAAISS